MPGPTMPRHNSRARAAEAFALRSAHWSWREIMCKLDYRSVGAAQSAVKAHVAREHRDPAEVTHREQVESVRLRNRVLGERFAVAFVSEDDDRLATLNRELARNGDQLAKLTGTYQPERQQVAVTVGRSPAEILAEGKSQLLAVLAERGNGRALPSAGADLNIKVDNGIDAIDAEVVER